MESRTRTIWKTLSWRAVATVITGVIAYLYTGELAAGLAIGFSDTLIKLFAYYFHERAWVRIGKGYHHAG